jgi:hypothetical protein
MSYPHVGRKIPSSYPLIVHFTRKDPSRPWQGLPSLTDNNAREVFGSLVQIKVGDGHLT